MFLHDLARRAGRKGIAAARQIGSGDRLRDRAALGPERHVLRVHIDAVRRCGCRRIERRARHAEHRQDVADAVGHRDDRRKAPRLRFRNRVGEDRLDLAHAERLGSGRRVETASGRRGRSGRRDRRRSGRAPAASATAGGEKQRAGRSKGRRAEEMGFMSHNAYRNARIALIALPSEDWKSVGL